MVSETIKRLDPSLFVSEIKIDNICGLCYHVPLFPRATMCCGRVSCQMCITLQASGKKITCPYCKEIIKTEKIIEAPVTVRELASEKIKCLNNTVGCTYTGQLGKNGNTLLIHYKNCEYNLIICLGCQVEFVKCKYDEHLTKEKTCPDPLMNCLICNKTHKRSISNEHNKSDEHNHNLHKRYYELSEKMNAAIHLIKTQNKFNKLLAKIHDKNNKLCVLTAYIENEITKLTIDSNENEKNDHDDVQEEEHDNQNEEDEVEDEQFESED